MDFFHVFNRGVDKRVIVLDDQDRRRFLHDLFVFNDTESVMNFLHLGRQDNDYRQTRKLLVHIHAFTLMENHYHLLLSEVVENGIPLFMQKLNMGYTKYFNEKYTRTGTLWQGRYKKVHIERSAHFLYIPYYIHLNPLDYVLPEWRTGGIKNPKKALKYLEEYRWSSHLDYLGIKNYPSITTRNELAQILGTRRSYEQTITDIITDPVVAQESNTLEFE